MDHIMKKQTRKSLLMILLMLTCYCVAGMIDEDDAIMDQKQYCSMTGIFKHDKTRGWPDYNPSVRCHDNL